MTPCRRALQFCLLAMVSSASAAQHRPIVHAQPGLTINGIAEDAQGNLWLATSQGLYRYDRLQFHKVPHTPFEEIRHIAVLADNSVWIGGKPGLARYDGNFQTMLKTEVEGIAASPDELLVTTQSGRWLTYFDRHGTTGRVSKRGFRNVVFDHGQFWATAYDGNLQIASGAWRDLLSPAELRLPTVPVRDIFDRALPDATGQAWLADDTRAVLHDSNGLPGRTLTRTPSRGLWRPSPLVRGRDRQLWFLGETVAGISPPVTLTPTPEPFPNIPTTGYQDRDGSLWVAVRGIGLIEWRLDTGWHRWFTEDFAHQPVVRAFRAPRGILATTHTSLLRRSADRWETLANPGQFSYILPEPDGTLLATLRAIGLVRLSPNGEIIERPKHPLPRSDWFRKILRDSHGRTWVGSKYGLFELTGPRGAQQLRRVPLPDEPSEEHGVLDLRLDSQGRLWAGYQLGLAWLDQQGKWHRLPTDHPSEPVRSFAFGGNGDGRDIWVAYRRKGSFTRWQQSGDTWKISSYDQAGGYGSESTRFFERDSRGWIWRGTDTGIYVCNGTDSSPWQWLHISRATGLASEDLDDYGFLEDTDGSVWLAASEGLTRLLPNPDWFAPHITAAPRLSRIALDGQAATLHPNPSPATLHARQTIALDLAPAAGTGDRDHAFLYTLTSGNRHSTPTPTNGTLRFTNLPSGTYTLNVFHSAGGPPLHLTFRYGPPARWPWLAAVAILAGLLRFAWNRPHVEYVRYWIAKTAFALRDRLHPQTLPLPAPTPALDYTGQTLAGRYLIHARISTSNYSVVYEALDQTTHQPVAIKALLPNAHQGWVRDRFATEVATLQSISHPNIVPIVHWWVDRQGTPFLVMPLLKGIPLRTVLDSGPLQPARLAPLLRQLASALHQVHSRGIIHRDIKPENILVVPGAAGEQAVLIDFGSAGLDGGQHGTTTNFGVTYHYMAPERLMGRYGPAGDLYALAVVALECLSGYRAIELRTLPSEPEFRAVLIDVLRSSLGAQAPGIAATLEPCFDANPDRRPSSVMHWANEISALLERSPA